MFRFIDFLFFILITFTFFSYIFLSLKFDNNEEYFYLKEYSDAIGLLNECDIKEEVFCYSKYKDKYKYRIVKNNITIFDNCDHFDPVFSIKRVYFNYEIVYFACKINQ